jgi:glucan phosphorylase
MPDVPLASSGGRGRLIQTSQPRTSHAAELFRLLEDEVGPEFYARDEHGIPRAWLTRVRNSLRTLGPEFGAGRMLEDYETKVYGAS